MFTWACRAVKRKYDWLSLLCKLDDICFGRLGDSGKCRVSSQLSPESLLGANTASAARDGLWGTSTMYGFVNQALQEFIIRESSFETWEEILYVYIYKSAFVIQASAWTDRAKRPASAKIEQYWLQYVKNFSFAIDLL